MSATFQLVLGRSPRPPGSALQLGDVPDDLLLRSASAPQRERLLVGLAHAHAHADAPSPKLKAALQRVASEANALALQQTLEFSARQGSLGFVVEALELDWLLALGASRGVAVSDVLATTDTVGERGLTRSEARRIQENFGNTLDPGSIRFRFTTGAQTMGAGAMALGNTIHVDPTDPRWALRRGTTLPDAPDDESWDSYNGVLLAHEPSHVWSYQHQGSRYAVTSVVEQLAAIQQGGRAGAYLYRPDRAHFLDYGEEQRAMLVQDFVTATRARQRGETASFATWAGMLPVETVLSAITKYIEQMRAMGPGVPHPQGREAQWVVCPCVRFSQDGLAGALGRGGDALVGAIGRASTDAVVQGVTQRAPGPLAAGLAGVTAAVAASVLAREQAGNGATSGGSALLDQANIPRGVAIGRDGVTLSAKAAWDAPVASLDPSVLPVGVADPRVEWGAGVHRDVGEVRVDADASAVVARTGEVRRAEAALRLEEGDVAVEGRAGVVPQRGAAPQRVWAHVALVSTPVSVSAGGTVSSRDGVVQRAEAQSAVETQRGGLSTEARFSRPAADAPLALEEAKLKATLVPAPGTSVGLSATVVPAGLEGLGAQVATVGDAGTLSVSAEGTKLTTTPTVGVTVTATEKKSGVAVSANAQATPSTGAAQGGVSVSMPLPEPGQKKG